MDDEISKKDIPTADDMRKPYLNALRSGRPKSISTIENEVASELGLSKEQRKYKIKGSTTTLLSNRLKSVRILLQNDGLITPTKLGKVQLTEAGKIYLENEASPNTNPPEKDASGNVAQITDERMEPTSTILGQSDAQAEPKKRVVKVIRGNRPTSPESNNVVEPPVQTATIPQASDNPTETAALSTQGKILIQKNGIIAIIAIAVAIVLAVAFGIGLNGGSDTAQTQTSQESANAKDDEQDASSAEEAAIPETPELTLVVNAKDPSDRGVKVTVEVTGTTDAGKKIDTNLTIQTGSVQTLDYDAGTYLFSLVENDITNGNKVYKHDGAKVVFSGEKSLQIELNLVVDKDRTKAKEEEAGIKAAEEAGQKAEGEEQGRVDPEQQALAEQQEREAIDVSRKAATVALTNSFADDVFASDGNTHDPSRYHSYSDRSGFYLDLLQDGQWGKKDDSTWHVDSIRFSIPNSNAEMRASLDVRFNGELYIVSNITGMLAVPGKESYGTDLKTVEKWQPEGSSALSVPPYLLE